MDLALNLIPVVLAALPIALAVWSVRRDPRRASNSVLCGVAVITLVLLSFLGPGSALALIVMLLVGLSPLLALALVAALLVNGVLMVRREGRTLGNLLSGLTGLGLAGAMGVSVWSVFIDQGLSLALSMWIILAVAWLGFLFTCMVVYQAVYAAWAGQRSRPDFIVTLGSGLVRGKVGRLLGNRVRRGVQIAEQWRVRGHEPVLIMSGGQGHDEPRSEAEAMGEFAHQELAVPSQQLVLENRSTTTEENLRFTEELVRADPRLGADARGLAVTSNFHVLRAAELARRQGFAVQVTGAPVAWYYWPSAMLREFVAQLLYHRVAVTVLTVLVTVPLPLALFLASVL